MWFTYSTVDQVDNNVGRLKMAVKTIDKTMKGPLKTLENISFTGSNFLQMRESETGLDINMICMVLFETAAEGLVVVDKEGTILIANPRMEQMFGYSREELAGRKIEILIPDQFRGRHHAHREHYNKDPKARSMGVGLDLAGRRKDGSEFPVEISLNHFEVEGRMLVMGLITDITGRKKTEEQLHRLNMELEERVKERTIALQESQRLYSIIARNFPNGTINVFDKDLKYVFAEGKELYKLGVTSEKLVGTSYMERLAPEIAGQIEQELMDVFQGNNKSFEVAFNNNVYLLSAVALEDSRGDINQILVVEQNISKQKQAEHEMQRALSKEKQLNELKSRFVSMASHEFRTPLSTILSSLSLAERYLKPEDAEKRMKHFNRIRSSVHNLTAILNDFLSMDKLEEGKVEITTSEMNLKEFCTEVVEEMQVMARRGQQLIYEHSGEGDIVYSDKQILKNILFNLLSNSIKYSAEDKEIYLSTHLENDHFEIEVRDKGMGIPEDDLQYMFDRFFRARNAINIQGTGLGLNIVKKYIDLLGGNINLKSKEGEGTTITVVFPN